MNKFLSHLEKKASAKPEAKTYSAQEKKAALDALLEQGFDFDSAVSAIEKEAGIDMGAIKGVMGRVGSQVAGKAKAFATAAKADAPKLGSQVKTLATGRTTLNGARFNTNVSVGRAAAAKNLLSNKAVQAGAGAAAVAGAGGAAIGSAMGKKNDNG